jgi:two-component system nitrogen regulation response regulator GlnG/two-component system response regulator HydG
MADRRRLHSTHIGGKARCWNADGSPSGERASEFFAESTLAKVRAQTDGEGRSGDTTVDEESWAGPSAPFAAEAELALVIAFSADERARVGELAFTPASAPGPHFVLGRGPAVAADRYPRLVFGQQRPEGMESLAALSSPTLSRLQLAIHAHDDWLEVENVGRCPLLHNGAPVRTARVAAGDTLQLGRTLLLLCASRPSRLPRPAREYGTHAFGHPDAFGLVGESPALWKLRQQLAYVAARPGHVLLLGASGSGKELAARAIHGLSKPAGRALIARNAATIPESLADAELFGNAKNYPNPGMAARAGLIGEAHGGTLFLDEFAELSHAVQARLLRVLDAGEYQVLGESHARRSEFRLVAATNRPESAIKHDLQARFRFKIELPGLGARREDIPLLVGHLLARSAAHAHAEGDQAGRIGSEWIAARLAHDYAAHVRELDEQLTEALADAGHGGLLQRSQASAPPAAPQPQQSQQHSEPQPQHGALDPSAIQAMLDRHNGMIEATWRALGLKNRHALMRLVSKHGLEIRRRHRGSQDNGRQH